MRRKTIVETKNARSKPLHHANGVVRPDVAALVKERNRLRKRIAELRKERKMLIASLAKYMFEPVKINKREMLRLAKTRPTMNELIDELKKLGQ